MNVLLVASDLQLVQSLYGDLQHRGHRVTVAPDGEAACAALRSDSYALVILTGPSWGEEGLEVCRRLRAMPDGRRCVILAAGGADGPVDLAKLLSSGADDYLADLANIEELDVRLTVAEHRAEAAGRDRVAQTEPNRSLMASCPLLRDAPYGVFRSSLKGCFLEVNSSLVNMLGYESEEDLLAVSMATDIYQDPARRLELIAQLEEWGHLEGLEIDWKRKDGSPIPVLVSGRLTRDPRGNGTWVDGIVHDITEQKHAEEALRRSEIWFRSLIELGSTVYAVVNANGRVLYESPSLQRVYGWKPKEVLGTTVFQRVHPDDLDHAKRNFAELVQKPGLVKTVEIRYRRKDGSWRTIEVSGINLLDNPAVRGIVLTSHDVTAQKQIEQALRQSEQRYRLIAENVTDIIWTIDFGVAIERRRAGDGWELVAAEVLRRARFSYVSPSVINVLGYEPEELEAKSFQQVLSPGSFESLEGNLAVALAVEAGESGRAPVDPFLELEHRAKDGSVRWCEVTSGFLHDEKGRIVGAAGVTRDIGERIEAERALRESESKLRSLFQNLPDFVVMVDRNAVIQVVNRGIPEAPPEALVGSVGFDFIAPEYRPACQEAFRNALATREAQSVEARDVFGIWWACRVVPMGRNGEAHNVMVICTDVTEQKKAAREIQKEQRLLRQLLDLHERDRRLTAYEIHDGFAQQLTGARFNLEAFARLRHHEGQEAVKLFDAALQLVSDAIDESRRLISGLRPPVLDESGIVAAVDYLVCESREHEEAEIEFFHDVRFDRLAPPLESALFRIVQESLTNACRHSQSNKVRVELVQQGSRIHVCVRDWGIGFALKEIEEHRFGLQGIRERARLFGGQVTIETGPGRGTEVTVELPLVEAAPERFED